VNIFVTDPNPIISASYLDDKRVVKMVLESTQMLCTALNETGGSSPYRSTHKNHPCSIWARQSKGNWEWLWRHAWTLASEYEYRYGRVHKCVDILSNLDPKTVPEGKQTSWPNCTTYKHINDVHTAYMLYLSDKWESDKRTPTWYQQGR
jgi:hypothetical protein